MSKIWQNLFHKSLIDQDGENMLVALTHGAVINNGENKKNTLNMVILRMFNNHDGDRLNLNFLNDLIDSGAKICTNGNNNVLMIIIEHMSEYMRKQSIKGNGVNATKNIINLLDLMISKIQDLLVPDWVIELFYTKMLKAMCEYGIELDILSQILRNSVTIAIETKKIEIVRMVCECGGKPNISQSWSNTLTMAVIVQNVEMIKLICEHGGVPDSSQSDSNTLSQAVKTEKIEIVRLVCEHAGLPDSSQSNTNTMTRAVVTKNVEIIRLIHEYGGIPDLSHSDTNTLMRAIATESILCVRMICEYGGLCKPNELYGEYNILTHAVKTKNIEIIRVICDYGGILDVSITMGNTLYQAMRTLDPEIVFEIIFRGGKPQYYYYDEKNQQNSDPFKPTVYKQLAPNMLNGMFSNMHDKDPNDSKAIDRMVNLLLCSGAKYTNNHGITEPMAGMICYDNSYCTFKMEQCRDLLFYRNIHNMKVKIGNSIEEFKIDDSIEEFKKELSVTMNELMEDQIPRQQMIDRIDSVIYQIVPIPLPCILLIYEYARTKSLASFIDWINF